MNGLLARERGSGGMESGGKGERGDLTHSFITKEMAM